MGVPGAPRRLLFVVGARRSGTLWLQRGICAHPDAMGVPSESYLFTHGIEPLAGLFQSSSPGSIAVGKTYLPRPVLIGALRGFCDRVFDELTATLAPGARLVVERTPWHARVLPLIGEVYPDAQVLHIVRDGRDVTRSLLRQPWGPADMAEAAEEWRSTVELARAAAPALADYREVRYEQLRSDPLRGFGELFAWLGLPMDGPVAQRLAAEVAAPVNVSEPGRASGTGRWREELPPADLAAFDRVAGPLLRELGYADPAPPGGPAAQRGPRWRGVARLTVPHPSRRPGRGRDAAAPPPPEGARPRRAGGRVQQSQLVVDALLAAMSSESGAGLPELLTPDAECRMRGDEEWAERGPAGAARLAAAVGAAALHRGRLLRADTFPAGDSATAVTVHRTGSGRLLHRVLVAELSGGRIRALTCYQWLAAGELAVLAGGRAAL